MNSSAEHSRQHRPRLELLTVLFLSLHNTKDNLSRIQVQSFSSSHVSLCHSVSVISTFTFNLTEYEARNWAWLSITTTTRFITSRLMTTVGVIESNSNCCFVLMCQENHEAAFDASPICLHREATRPKAGLQVLAFTPCLSCSTLFLDYFITPVQ